MNDLSVRLCSGIRIFNNTAMYTESPLHMESRFECKVTQVFLFYKFSVSWCFECTEVVSILFYFANLQGSSMNVAGFVITPSEYV